MIKTLQQALKMDREKFKVPRSVQQAIPIQRIWPDGVFQSGTKFSKSFRFSDINYAIASKEDKTEMFLDYSELLNALDSGASAKITLNNRRINKEEFEASLLLPMKEDGLDTYRKEYNEMLLSKVSGTNNSIYQERYLTVSVHKKNIDEARTYFARVGTDIITHLSKLSSIGEELDAEQRLQIFRDFFQADQPQCFPFDMKAFAKRGSSFKDWICPQSMEFSKDCFKINERYGRVLDIGTGSGILAIAALKLGAASAEGVDIDPVAVRTAGENAALNGVQDKLTVLVGDLSDKASGTYDIITANIVANAILSLAPAVPGLMAEGATFIASGIIDSRKDEVIAGLEKAGLAVVEVKEKRGWECIVCKKA